MGFRDHRLARQGRERERFSVNEPSVNRLDSLRALLLLWQDGKPHRHFKRVGVFDVGLEHLESGKLVRQADLLGKAMDVSERFAEVEVVFVELKDLALSTPSKSVKDLPVNGHDVMRITGHKPGPAVGTVLNDLFERVVNGELPEDRKQLLAAMQVEDDVESLPFD